MRVPGRIPSGPKRRSGQSNEEEEGASRIESKTEAIDAEKLDEGAQKQDVDEWKAGQAVQGRHTGYHECICLA